MITGKDLQDIREKYGIPFATLREIIKKVTFEYQIENAKTLDDLKVALKEYHDLGDNLTKGMYHYHGIVDDLRKLYRNGETE